jgi:hypothetical protein
MKKTKIIATIGPASSKREVLKEMILEGMPFYKIHSVFYAEKIKSGIYDKTDLTRIGVSKEDLEQFKQIMK